MTTKMPGTQSKRTEMGLKNLATDSAYLLIAGLVGTVTSTVAGLILVRILLPSYYGMVAYFLRVFGLVRFLGTLGLGAKVIEDVSHYSALGDQHGLGKAVYSLGSIRLAIGGILLLLLTFLSWVQDDATFLWAGLAGLFASVGDYMNALLQGLRRRKAVAGLSLLQPALFLASVLLMSIMVNAVPTMIYAAFTFSFVTLLAGSFLSLRRAAIPQPFRQAISRPYLRGALRPLTNLVIFGLLNYLYLSLGSLILGSAKLFEENAFFSAAFGLVAIPTTLGFVVITAVFYPELVAMLAHDRREEASRLLTTFMRLFLTALTPVMAALAVYSGFIVRLVYTETYDPSIVPLAVLSPLAMLVPVQQLLVFGLYALGEHRQASIGMGIQVLLALAGTLGAMFWAQGLRPVWIAVAGLAACIVGLAVHWTALKRQSSFRVSAVQVIGATLLAMPLMVLPKALTSCLLPRSELLAVALGLAISAPLCLSANAMLLFGRREWRSFMARVFTGIHLRLRGHRIAQ